MGQSVTGSNNLQTNFQQTSTFGVGGSATLPDPVKFRSAFLAAGTLADQCNLFYAATLTFVASTPQTLNLHTGAMLDIAGNALVFARARFVAIRVNSTTDGAGLTVGNSSTNEWDAFLSSAGTLFIPASTSANDGFFLIQAPNTTGFAVTTSHCTLKLDPGSGAFTADVLIAGCDA